MLRFRVLGASFSSFGCFVFELWVLRFRTLGASFSNFGCFVFELWMLRFRTLGASFSNFGCFVLRSSFSSASFSKLPPALYKNTDNITDRPKQSVKAQEPVHRLETSR